VKNSAVFYNKFLFDEVPDFFKILAVAKALEKHGIVRHFSVVLIEIKNQCAVNASFSGCHRLENQI
jgi:hypothetical protein